MSSSSWLQQCCLKTVRRRNDIVISTRRTEQVQSKDRIETKSALFLVEHSRLRIFLFNSVSNIAHLLIDTHT